MPKSTARGFAKRQSTSTRVTGRARALSNQGSTRRSPKATAALTKARKATKKMKMRRY